MKNNKLGAYLFLAIGSMLLFIFIIDDAKKSREADVGLRTNYSQEIAGIVSSVSQNRGLIKLRLTKNKDKIFYFDVMRNYNLTPYNFHEFIKAGDSIFKASYSKELWVIRDNKKYRFIFGESIKK